MAAQDAIDSTRPVSRAITSTDNKSNGNPAFSPDSARLAFLSNREGAVAMCTLSVVSARAGGRVSL